MEDPLGRWADVTITGCSGWSGSPAFPTPEADPAASIATTSVHVVPGALAETAFYVHHVPATQACEAHWYIGPIDVERPGTPCAATVAALQRLRPDLASLLSLPVGWIAIVEEGRITCVLDDSDDVIAPPQR